MCGGENERLQALTAATLPIVLSDAGLEMALGDLRLVGEIQNASCLPVQTNSFWSARF